MAGPNYQAIATTNNESDSKEKAFSYKRTKVQSVAIAKSRWNKNPVAISRHRL